MQLLREYDGLMHACMHANICILNSSLEFKVTRVMPRRKEHSGTGYKLKTRSDGCTSSH